MWGEFDLGRTLGTAAILAAAVAVWAVAFRSGWSSTEWTGFWASAPPTRGDTVPIREKEIKDANERSREHIAAQTGELVEVMRDLRKDLLGDKRATRGDPVRGPRMRIPKDVQRYTQRDACFQLKLEYPERFGGVDCMSDKFDDVEPWYRAPRAPP